ncbi:hypothetical protein QYE76_007526 [Lolium multiflorum]|uniref:Uncharacterized protein n=1 Tax=Lolium multiflorum TaxID=4521 RepID=A0AAD8UW09_LOLMU|nr:hypothetical protein QYE76_007526 [Lolium multiflorum]
MIFRPTPKRRLKTLVKIPRGQQLNTLAEEDFRTILRVPVSGATQRRLRKTARRKRSKHPAGGPSAHWRPRARLTMPELARPPPSPKTTNHLSPDSGKVERARPKDALSMTGMPLRGPSSPAPRKTSEIQDFKKNVGQFCDQLICKQKEQQVLHYELHKNIALQRRVTLSQAENIRSLKDENAELTKQLADAQGWRILFLGYDLLELENLRSSYQDLETRLKESGIKEGAGSIWRRKTPHTSRKKGGDLERRMRQPRIKRQQKELNGLRKYMETAEHHWDLLNENILEPLGYPEQRRNLFPRDDLLQLAGDDCKDLISAARYATTYPSRGVTTGVPPDADVSALLDAVSGYDTRIARRIRHEEFYDRSFFVTNPWKEQKGSRERDLRNQNPICWTSSKGPRRTQDQPLQLR